MADVDRTLNNRIAKQWTPEGFVDIDPMNIKAGMMINLYEADGTPVLYNNQSLFHITKDAMIDENGVVGFQFSLTVTDESFVRPSS